MSRLRRALGGLPGACLWLAGMAVFSTWPLARFAPSRVPENLLDPLENVWIFAWGAHAVVHHPLQLFDANMFAPERYTFAFTENMLGLSLPLAPVYWLTHNAVLMVNLALLLVLAASGLGVVVLVRELTGFTGAGVAAGTAYMVMPYRVFSVFHPHVVATHLTPWVLWALVRVARPRARTSPRRPVILLGLLVAVQAWSSFTGALVTALAVLGWAAWELARHRRGALPELARASAGVALGVALSAPLGVPYLLVRHHHPEYTHPPAEAVRYSATPGSYLSPPGGGPVTRPLYRSLGRRFANHEVAYEKELFPGVWLSAASVVALVAVLAAAVRRRAGPGAAGAWLGLVLAGVGLVMSMGPRFGARPGGPYLPFSLVASVSGGLTRVPARVGVLAALGLAVLVGSSLGGASLRLRRVLVALSLGALALESAPPALSMVSPPPITAAHRALGGRHGVILALPTAQLTQTGDLDNDSIQREAHHLYLSTASFGRMTNGYAAFAPTSYVALVRAVQDLPSANSFASLGVRDVRILVVQTDLLPGTPWKGIVVRLQAWPGVRLMGAGRGVRIYDVSRATGTPSP